MNQGANTLMNQDGEYTHESGGRIHSWIRTANNMNQDGEYSHESGERIHASCPRTCKMPWITSLSIENGILYWCVSKALASWEKLLRGEMTKTSIKSNTLTYVLMNQEGECTKNNRPERVNSVEIDVWRSPRIRARTLFSRRPILNVRNTKCNTIAVNLSNHFLHVFVGCLATILLVLWDCQSGEVKIISRWGKMVK